MRRSVLLFLPLIAGCPDLATDARVDDVDVDLEALEAENASLEQRVATLESLVVELTGRTDSHDVILTGHATQLTDHEARVEALESSAVLVLDADTTYSVESVEDLDAVLAELDGLRIAAGVTVTVAFADGTYSFPDTLKIDHPDGRQIRLVGDESDPDDVVLQFPGTDGVTVPAGRDLGLLSGFAIVGTGRTGGTGVKVDANGTLFWGPLRISSFNTGVGVSDGGAIQPDDAGCTSDTIEVEDGGWGFIASTGGVMDVCGGVATGMDNSGFYAELLGVLSAQGSSAAENGQDGYHAAYGAVIVAPEAMSSGNGDVGFEALFNATIYAPTSSDVGGYGGYSAAYGSTIHAEYAESENAVYEAFSAGSSSSIYAKLANAISPGHFGFAAGNSSAMGAYGTTVTGGTSAYQAGANSYIDARYGVAIGDVDSTYAFASTYQGGISTEGTTSSGYTATTYSDSVSNTYGFVW